MGSARALGCVLLLAGLATGCGLVDFAERGAEGEADAAPFDSRAADAATTGPDAVAVDAGAVGGTADAGPTCPADMALIPMTVVCIDRAQRGSLPWAAAGDTCNGLGRRLCSGAEWEAGCATAAGLTDTIDDWEWVAELVGPAEAAKRGSGACSAASSHSLVDPYGVRCCAAAGT